MATALPRSLPLVVQGSAAAGCGSAGGCAPGTPDGVRTLIDEFLAVQAGTTAVERFAAAHAGPEVLEPAQARWYRDLLPATPPGPGQQYAFAVDLDACTGCKACVAACHSLNGLDEGESWREVGLLVGTGDTALLQPVTTGCHHCVEPGCLDGCPVDAYVKHEDGVVQHLDDQCIGCSYCTLTCPYEVPQYDAGRGIVRKCDMCHDRLAEGEAPACVQGCPTNAISITVVDVEQAGREGFGFASPDHTATRPTTVFRGTRDLATDVAAADEHTFRPRHAHPPLVVMLTLSQLAVGAFVGVEVMRATGALAASSAAVGALTALGLTVLALLASLAHLGRPQYAWRAVIGLRHSWLSREIVAFGLFAPLGALHSVAVAGWRLPLVASLPPDLTGIAAGAAGVVAVATSVMVYVATRRRGWRPTAVARRFGLTTATLGAATTTVAAVALPQVAPTAALVAARTTLALLVVVLVVDLAQRRDPAAYRDPVAARTAGLLRGPLAPLVRWRVGTGLVALATASAVQGLAATAATDGAAASTGGVALVLATVTMVTAALAEGCARWWFFTAEGSPRMPGSLA